MSQTAVFDYNKLLSNFYDEKEVVNEVLNVFITKVSSQLIEIEKLLAEEDFKKLREEVHSIKGSSWNITAKQFGDTASQLEIAAKEENIKTFNDLFPGFKEQYQVLEAKIKEHIE